MFFLSSSLVVLGVLLTKGAKARTEDGYIADEYQDSEWLTPAHENIQTVTPPCCQKASIEDVNHVLVGETFRNLNNYIYVSTMNGKLIALDASNNGNVLWELDLEGAPLLSGTLSGMPPMEANGKWYHLVPALDGSLYMYSRNDRLLEPIPLNTEILLQSSVRIAQDAVAGGKIVTTTGVDPLSGEIRYHCTAANCNNGVNEDVQSTLVFRRSTNSVRAVDALTGIERWNLSVAEYDASLVKKSSTLSSNRLNGLRILVQPPDGVVTAYDGCGNMVWSQSVGSHIVKSWKIESGELEEISLFDAYNIHTLAVADEFNQPDSRIAETLFYLGMSNNDPFIIHSGSVKNELQKMARNALDMDESIVHQPGSQLVPADKRAYFIQGKTIDELLRFSFGKTYTAKQNTNAALIDDQSSELTVVNPNRVDGHVGSCPNGDGVSLIKEDDMRSATFDHASGDKGWYVLKPGSSKMVKSPFLLSKAKQCAARFSQHVDSWWSFSIGMMAGLSTGVVTLGTVFAYFCYKRMQRKLLRLESVPRKITETRETSSGPSLNGEPGSIPSTPSEPTPIVPITRERRTTSGNSNSQSETFTSKFFHDFEPVKLLGHGGFGYVYKAKHRLDEGHYAVKRIAVADNDRAIQKVLREVRAMAKLDHRGIIRYYHTWIERPPPGWQEENDRDTLADLKIRSKTFDGEGIEKQRIAEASTQDISVSPISIQQCSVDVPAMPEDSNDGSWFDSQPGNPNAVSSASGSDGSESDTESSDSEIQHHPHQGKIGKFKSKNSVEASDGIIFGHSESISKSKSSKSSEDLWNQSKVQQMVLVTSVDEELLPCRNTESFVYLYIQMQLCQEKTLHSWLKRHKKQEHRSLPVMKAWLAQLCSAVNYIHSQGMIHRDLKPQNIFFFDDNHQHLKVGDLGLITKGSSPEEKAEEYSSKDTHSSHTDNVGTRGYMSPEQIANQAYTLKIDVFSLGLIFCELVIPFQTFMERSRTLGSLQRGEVPDILKECGKDERKMVLWMTKMNPAERPPTDDVLSSEYLADVDEDFGAGSRRRYRSERNSSFDRKISANF